MLKDMSGNRFGRLLVVDRGASVKGTAMWVCMCDCGERRLVAGTGLRAGRNVSCGCASPRFDAARTTTHGGSGSRTYRIWAGMHRRCSPSASGRTRKNYFLKGIRVCDRWKLFDNFIKDMGEAPDGLSIDRIRGEDGYSPENCRWATAKQQANNTGANRVVTHLGKSQTVSQWAAESGIKPNTLEYRLLRGWSIDDAVSRPVQKRCAA